MTAEERARIVQDSVWQAGIFGGSLFAVAEILRWLRRDPEALGDLGQYGEWIEDYLRRLDEYETGWTQPRGFYNPDFRTRKVKSLDEAFYGDGGPNGRAPGASEQMQRPTKLGVRQALRVRREVARWRAGDPENRTVTAALLHLALTDRFPGVSLETLRRRYYKEFRCGSKAPNS